MIFWLALKFEISYRVMMSRRILVCLEDWVRIKDLELGCSGNLGSAGLLCGHQALIPQTAMFQVLRCNALPVILGACFV
jgi:hypothetical protein